jgi:hypothetical protein
MTSTTHNPNQSHKWRKGVGSEDLDARVWHARPLHWGHTWPDLALLYFELGLYTNDYLGESPLVSSYLVGLPIASRLHRIGNYSQNRLGRLEVLLSFWHDVPMYYCRLTWWTFNWGQVTDAVGKGEVTDYDVTQMCGIGDFMLWPRVWTALKIPHKNLKK